MDDISDEQFEYLMEIARQYKRDYKEPSEAEIINIFQDIAPEIIKSCLAELTLRREEIIDSITSKLRLINRRVKDDSADYFWKPLLIHVFDGKDLQTIDQHIARLKRMQWLTGKQGKQSKKDYEYRKQFALQRSIVEVVQPFVGEIKKCGPERFKTLCPFHSERTPSFVIYADQSNHFYCYGCGKGGDTISFVRLIKDCSFPEAIDFLNNS